MRSAAIWDLSQSLPDDLVDDGTIGIGSSIKPNEVIDLVVEKGLRHIVQRDGLAYEQEVQCAQNIISDPLAFLNNPLEVIFGGDAMGNFTDFRETASADEKKNNVLHQFNAYLSGLSGARNIRDEAMLIADEIYTNGSKNAAPLVGNTPTEEVKPGWVQFIARADSKRLVLGCIDSYGALDVTMLVQRIQSVFQKGIANSIQQGSGGAGIGSYMVFNSCLSFYIGVEKEKKTIVLCALPIGMRRKDADELSKNIHTIIVD